MSVEAVSPCSLTDAVREFSLGWSFFFFRVGEHGCSGEISCVKHVCCACLVILLFLISRLASRSLVCSQLQELNCLKPRGTDIVAVQRSVTSIVNW